MALTFDVRQSADASILICKGVIIFGEESSALRTKAKELLASSRFLVLDLAGVSYVDSGGLGAIVGIFTTARAAGGDIKLANVNQRVRHVLEITRLLSVFHIYNSVEEAVQAFGRGAAA